MRVVHFTYPGTPVPRPRMTQRDKWKRRPVVQNYFAFRDALLPIAQSAGLEPDDIIFMVGLVAHFPLTKSWSKKKKQFMSGKPHTYKPDLDNVIKGLLDGLGKEDSTVYKINPKAEKFWDDGHGPRMEVWLYVDTHNPNRYPPKAK